MEYIKNNYSGYLYGYGCEDGSETALKTTAEAYTYYSDVTLTGCTFDGNTVTGTTTLSATTWTSLGTGTVYNETPGGSVNATTYPYGVTYQKENIL